MTCTIWYMRFEIDTVTTADLTRAWDVVTDIEHWPDHMASYEWVRREDTGPLKVGQRAVLKQPGLAKSKWQVTVVDEKREFVWVSRTPGIKTVASHAVASRPGGGTTIALAFEMTGPIAGLAGRLYAKKIRRYLDIEAAGMKAASEA